MMRLIATLILGLLLPFGLSANAEPGPVGRWLMNEPVSLFDLGMLRLKYALQFEASKRPTIRELPFRNAYYDWDRNRIVIVGNISEYYSSTESFTKQRCSELLSSLRKFGGIDPKSGKTYAESLGMSVDSSHTYASYFSHIGYAIKNKPENFREELLNMFRVMVIMENGSCEGRLLSNEVLYREDSQ